MHPTGGQEVVGSTPARLATFFHGDDYEIFSVIILSLPLSQEGQLSVSCKRLCTLILVITA